MSFFLWIVGLVRPRLPHETAIARKTLSVPARRLRDADLVKGRVLDYGCGRGRDAKALRCDKYDPHYAPIRPRGKFDTILCSYVLNVLDTPERSKVLADIRKLLKKDGIAYITVRRDANHFQGLSWQHLVELDLPTVWETSSYCVYKLEARSSDSVRRSS